MKRTGSFPNAKVALRQKLAKKKNLEENHKLQKIVRSVNEAEADFYDIKKRLIPLRLKEAELKFIIQTIRSHLEINFNSSPVQSVSKPFVAKNQVIPTGAAPSYQTNSEPTNPSVTLVKGQFYDVLRQITGDPQKKYDSVEKTSVSLRPLSRHATQVPKQFYPQLSIGLKTTQSELIYKFKQAKIELHETIIQKNNAIKALAELRERNLALAKMYKKSNAGSITLQKRPQHLQTATTRNLQKNKKSRQGSSLNIQQSDFTPEPTTKSGVRFLKKYSHVCSCGAIFTFEAELLNHKYGTGHGVKTSLL